MKKHNNILWQITIVKIKIFKIVALSIIGISSILYSENKEAEKWFYKGYEAKDNNLKIECFTKAISIDPTDAKVYYNRGNTYYDLNLFNEAVKDYSKAISLEPFNADFYNNRGNTYLRLNLYKKSIKDYSKSISIDSNDAITFSNRANALGCLKRYEDAIKDYSKALSINTKDTYSYYQRGLVFGYLNRFDYAIKDFTQALSIDSNNADIYYARGVVYYKINLFDGAIKDFTQALSIDSNNADIYYARGAAYYNIDFFDEAFKDIKKRITLNPDSTSKHYSESKLIYNHLKKLEGNKTEGWLVDGKLTTQTYNLKFEKGFGAQLWQTDDSSFFELWNTPSDTMRLPIVSSVKRGTPIYMVILFGNAGFKNGKCNVVADMVIYDPKGKIYGERKKLNVWKNLPPLSNREIGLSVEHMIIIIEPKDPNGTYNVIATVTDKLKKVKVKLETKFTVE